MRFLLILVLFVYQNTSAQKIEAFYDYKWAKCSIEDARFFTIIEKKGSIWHRQDYYLATNKLQMVGSYLDMDCKKPNGSFTYYHPNGQLSTKGNYSNGEKVGEWHSYHQNGMMEDSGFYKNGKIEGIFLSWYHTGDIKDSTQIDAAGNRVSVGWFINGSVSFAGKINNYTSKVGKWQYYHNNGQKSAEIVYGNNNEVVSKVYFSENGALVVDTLGKSKSAECVGGIKAWVKFIEKNLVFPPNHIITNANTIAVVVDFWIDENGNVVNPTIKVPFHEVFNAAALKIFEKAPKWRPCIHENRRVPQLMSQPLIFTQTEM